jgi:hypothetical protein
VGRHAAGGGGQDRLVAAALARRRPGTGARQVESTGGLGWPGPASPDGGRQGWPGDATGEGNASAAEELAPAAPGSGNGS